MLMNKKVLYISVFIISFLIIFAGLYWFLIKSKSGPLKQMQISVGSQTFSVEVADSLKSRAKGLSERESMEEKTGMYFIFPIKAKYSIWMKDMYFPLDIVWIADGKVVGFKELAETPGSNDLLELPTYYPPEPVNAVLELNAGSVKKFGLKVGDAVTLK